MVFHMWEVLYWTYHRKRGIFSKENREARSEERGGRIKQIDKFEKFWIVMDEWVDGWGVCGYV